MNRTRSGAISVGAPMSLARFAEEASNAKENSHNLLLLTEEGLAILKRYANSVGCDFDMMLEFEKKNPRHVSDWLDKETNGIFSFLCAIIFCKELT